jgi:hypothetical protein
MDTVGTLITPGHTRKPGPTVYRQMHRTIRTIGRHAPLQVKTGEWAITAITDRTDDLAKTLGITSGTTRGVHTLHTRLHGRPFHLQPRTGETKGAGS